MKYLIILPLLILGYPSRGQDKNLLQQKKYFDKELKPWTKTFNNFNLSGFKVEDTVHFDNSSKQDFSSYKKFLSIYKPVITYSPDSSQFIDIYSYQLNLIKKRNYYYAMPDLDQTVFLCNPKTKYWDRIWFGTSSQWIDEIVWISKTKFILAGIIKSADYRKRPLIILGDTKEQMLVSYLNKGKHSFQTDNNYSSPKLKKRSIEGL